MADERLSVTPYGDRWSVERRAQRVSLHESLAEAMKEVMRLAHQAMEPGDEMPILIRDRDGRWREEIYVREYTLFGRGDGWPEPRLARTK